MLMWELVGIGTIILTVMYITSTVYVYTNADGYTGLQARWQWEDSIKNSY